MRIALTLPVLVVCCSGRGDTPSDLGVPDVPDLGFCARREAGAGDAGDSMCTKMQYEDHGYWVPTAVCPIDPFIPECQGADTCALVARDRKCWIEVFCWPPPREDFEDVKEGVILPRDRLIWF